MQETRGQWLSPVVWAWSHKLAEDKSSQIHGAKLQVSAPTPPGTALTAPHSPHACVHQTVHLGSGAVSLALRAAALTLQRGHSSHKAGLAWTRGSQTSQRVCPQTGWGPRVREGTPGQGGRDLPKALLWVSEQETPTSPQPRPKARLVVFAD